MQKNVHDWRKAARFIPTHAPCPPRQTPTTGPPPKFQSTSQIPVPAHTRGVLGYWDTIMTMMDTQLLDCFFEIDSQQQDWREEGYEENEEETRQGPTIATIRDY